MPRNGKRFIPRTTAADELRPLAEAASEGMTRPGWFWTGLSTRTKSTGAHVELAFWGEFGITNAMSFKRMGMSSAKPMFYEYVDGWSRQVDSMGEDKLVHECSYRDDIVGFSTPVAEYLAAVDPLTVVALLDERDELLSRVAELERGAP